MYLSICQISSDTWKSTLLAIPTARLNTSSFCLKYSCEQYSVIPKTLILFIRNIYKISFIRIYSTVKVHSVSRDLILSVRSIFLRSFLISGVLALGTLIAYSILASMGWNELLIRLMLPFEYWLTLILTSKASALVCSLPVIGYRLGCADIALIFLWVPVLLFVHFLMWAVIGLVISLLCIAILYES